MAFSQKGELHLQCQIRILSIYITLMWTTKVANCKNYPSFEVKDKHEHDFSEQTHHI